MVVDRKSVLWVVSELYYPEQTSTGYFLTKISEGLADDYDVRVICGQPSYSERGMRSPRNEMRHGTRIHRLRATHFDKDRLILRVINVVTFTIAVAFFALAHMRRGSRILVVTNPPSVPIVIGLIARLKRCRASLLVHDVYPEVLSATGMLSSSGLKYAILKRIFDATYRRFDRIIVLGDDMAEIVSAKRGGDRGIEKITNWGDIDEIAPLDRRTNAFRLENSLADKFVVQFSGNIGRTHDIELLMEAADLLRGDPTIIFLFVGYGGKTGLLTDDAAKRPNVRFLPRQPRERLRDMLCAADVTVISFVDGMFGLSVPSRMYNVMAAGVPIVAAAHPRSELATTVTSDAAGWLLAERDPRQLADLIRRLASPMGREEVIARGRAGRTAAVERYSLAAVLDQYKQHLAKL